MKKAATLLAAWICIALPALAHSTPTLPVQKEERQVTNYHSIKVDGPFKVILSAGETGSITLKGESEMLSIITTAVTDGTLTIALAVGKTLPLKQKVEIKVPFRLLNRVDLVGSGTIEVNNTIKNDIKVSVDGCGSVNLKANTNNVEAYLLGQGEITVKGTAQNFTCKIIGCGHIMAYHLNAEKVTACISGSGTIATECKKAITGRINGSGSITFSGNPEIKDLRRSGQGEFTMI